MTSSDRVRQLAAELAGFAKHEPLCNVIYEQGLDCSCGRDDAYDQMTALALRLADECDALQQENERQAKLLEMLTLPGYCFGKWADELRHADPCDCDLDEEIAGDNCMANSEWTWALFEDRSGYLSLVCRLPVERDDDGVPLHESAQATIHAQKAVIDRLRKDWVPNVEDQVWEMWDDVPDMPSAIVATAEMSDAEANILRGEE